MVSTKTSLIAQLANNSVNMMWIRSLTTAMGTIVSEY